MGAFDEELRRQLEQARQELAAARTAGDDDGVQAYVGRVAGLLRLAALHGIQVPHEVDEEGEG
ncbi:hypothetical protein [Peterkaempfera bronchialis]|uniref:Uncharacterized protein n=1 Tax=Peterkaempfera bronchialis TaxID=2126346 RepID=A0A345SZA0_9ACTN|nr:hypothetical protein [Peterkaempfera bronchialis]AXI79055.1 hypothetical protein C7M71_018185 [Peterkaempfera bronchialis]